MVKGRTMRLYLRAVIYRQKWLVLSGGLACILLVYLVPGGPDTSRSFRAVRPVDYESDTWRGPLPKGSWETFPRKYLISHPLYKWFKRSDLRIWFKPLSPVTDDGVDNLAEFPCTQSQSATEMDLNITEDIMCINRPKYRPDLLNPCYNQTMWGTSVQCLPRFHVLGVDKCGTTDFHSRLIAHPQILPNGGGWGKETYFWSWQRYGVWMKGRLQRKLRFINYLEKMADPAKWIMGNYTSSGKQLVTGDGTPMDFWDFRAWFLDPHNEGLKEPKFMAPHAMKHIYKDPRFFVLLRDPADRTFSDYIFMSYGKNPEKFAMDVPRAIHMIKNCLAVNSTRQCFFSDEMYHKLPIRIHTSCYSVFLREWLSVFDKRHFFIVRTQDYHNDMERILLKAYDFIGVSRPSKEFMAALVNRTKRHETKTKTWTGKMFPETRALLNEFFARFNQDLAKLLEDKRFLFQTPDNLDGGI